MKKIAIIAFLLYYNMIHAQIRNGLTVFPQQGNSFRNGNDTVYLVSTNTSNIFFNNDSVNYNADLDYLYQYYNTGNEDSLSALVDTVLYRYNQVLYYDTISHTYTDTFAQKIGLFWQKSISFDEASVDRYTVFSTCWTPSQNCHCTYYKSRPRTVCNVVMLCDLNYHGDAAYHQNAYWCSDYAYTMVFEDNFEGNELDRENWQVLQKQQINGLNSSIYELDAPDLVEVSNNPIINSGTLKLRARYDPAHSQIIDGHYYEWFCGGIQLNPKFGYGKYEVRARIDSRNGTDPTWWLRSDNAEFDAEFLDPNPTTPAYTVLSNKMAGLLPGWCQTEPQQNLVRIYNEPAKDNHGNNLNVTDGQFHTFSIIWDPNYIAFWVDETYANIINNVWQNGFQVLPNQNCGCSTCKVDQLVNFPDNSVNNATFILENAVFGSWTSNGSSTQYLGSIEFDWVRIYQKDNCGTNVNIPTEDPYLDFNHNLQNEITGDIITLGGAGYTNPFLVDNQPWTGGGSGQFTSVQYNRNQILFARANNEVQMKDGFSVSPGSRFEATINYYGDCSDINDIYTQYYRTSNSTENSSTNHISNAYGLVNNTENKSAPSPNQKPGSLTIYPIPAQNSLYIKGIDTYSAVEILDATMQRVTVLNGMQEKIDVSALASGLYFLKIYANNKVIIGKFIKG